MHVEQAVRERYSAAAHQAEAALCCPVEYDRRYLEVLPEEIIERDYGCGDPSRYVRAGETVLDLGSGGGKTCFIASQVVGAAGRVIGVDMNDEMLALARKYQAEIGRRIGWQNVAFHKARIQDLALDLDRLEQWLAERPVQSVDGWLAVQRQADEWRATAPLIAPNSIDVVVSNCVLNLVRPDDRHVLFAELFRVLRPGGRAIISDIVSDRPVPEHLRRDPKLWSGCISGAFVEHEFLAAFTTAGFHGAEFIVYQSQPWAVVEGLEFRSVTVRASKPAPATEPHSRTVIFRGPWHSVTHDEGHTLRRGERTVVSPAQFAALTAEPFAPQIIAVSPPETDSHSPRNTFESLSTLPVACCDPGCC